MRWDDEAMKIRIELDVDETAVDAFAVNDVAASVTDAVLWMPGAANVTVTAIQTEPEEATVSD